MCLVLETEADIVVSFAGTEQEMLRKLPEPGIAAVAEGVALGDDGADARAEAAAELWASRAELDRRPPVAPDLGVLAERLRAVHAAETEAVEVLAAL